MASPGEFPKHLSGIEPSNCPSFSARASADAPVLLEILQERVGHATADKSRPVNLRSPATSPNSHNQYSFAGPAIRGPLPETQAQPLPLPRLIIGRDGIAGGELNSAKSHHRNTSIVHGIQHSRNGSVASSSPSPLSPEVIAAAGGDWIESMSDLASLTSMASSGSTLVPDRGPAATEHHTAGPSQQRMERMHSSSGSRSRREQHGRQHSHSKHHKGEKTVGEYALHVLFTSVRLLPARTLSLC